MNINVPQENPNIPLALTQAITTVRNQISLGEAEVDRLQSLITSSEYTISQLVLQNKELEDNNIVLSSKKDTLSKEIEVLTISRDDLLAKKEETENYIKIEIEKLGEKVTEVDNLVNKIREEKTKFDVDLSNFAKDKASFDEEKKAFDIKVSKLKELI